MGNFSGHPNTLLSQISFIDTEKIMWRTQINHESYWILLSGYTTWIEKYSQKAVQVTYKI